MTSIENLRNLRALRKEKISLHEAWKTCEVNGDRVGMQRYKNMIKKIDREILRELDKK